MQVATYKFSATDAKGWYEIENAVRINKVDMKAVELKILPNKTAILAVNTFSSGNFEGGYSGYEKIMAKSFRAIDSLEIQNLIIDIRRNEGGSGDNDAHLFSYIASKPYNIFWYAEISAFTYSFNEFTTYSTEDFKELEDELREEYTLDDDGRLTQRDGGYTIEPLRHNSYQGEVFILTSGATYSMGATFSTLMRQHTNAIFIG